MSSTRKRKDTNGCTRGQMLDRASWLKFMHERHSLTLHCAQLDSRCRPRAIGLDL